MMALCCLPFTGWAQSGRKPQGQQPGQQPGEKPIVRLETREVAIPLSAYDVAGKYVDDLTPKDVLVLEDGESRPVSDVKREPANIVLILDLSNEIGTFKNGPTERFSTEERPIWEKGSNYRVLARPTAWVFAEFFIRQLSSKDSLAVIQYSDRVQLVQDWTNDSKQALNSISSKYRVGVKSSYLDALKLAADKLQTRPRGRRVIVLVSDGLDSNSKTGKSQAMAALAKARASLFIVGWAQALKTEIENALIWANVHETYNTSNAQRSAELRRHIPQLEAASAELSSLAEATGGEFWEPATHTDLIKTWAPIVSEIGAQYSLSFVTESKPSLEDLRSIKVISARQGVTLRSTHTYYAGDGEKPSKM